MSADIHDKFIYKEERSLLHYCEGNLSFSAASHDDDYGYKKKISRDPMSHRIIEKRRRDRMNNCLADLSRLIPPEYLKKGRGRIEKTEIIEMAIKHIGHLQNVIATTRFNDNSNSSIPSPPAANSILTREPSSDPLGNHSLTLKHYKMGYLECMSEVMHFLVEVQGYFAGDSLCVQMVNHLRNHCDKLLNGDAYAFSKKSSGGDLASSDSSRSPPINNAYNGSSPLGMSHSAGSASDDNRSDPSRGFPPSDYYSPKKYLDLCCGVKKYASENGCYPKYVESDGMESETRSDSEVHSNVILQMKEDKNGRKCSKRCCEAGEAGGKDAYAGTGNIHMRNIHAGFPEPDNYNDRMSVKEENCASQLREMLTSPTSLNHPMRGDASPLSNASSQDIAPVRAKEFKSALNSAYTEQACGGVQDGDRPGSTTNGNINHVIMYKFKNNIKQRFSKEKRENSEFRQSSGDSLPPKKQKPSECEESLIKERLSLMERSADIAEREKVHKMNSEEEAEEKRLRRFGPEPETRNGDLPGRLNFGHKAFVKRWEESGSRLSCPEKPWTPSPDSPFPSCEFPGGGCKVPAPVRRHPVDYFFNNNLPSASGEDPECGIAIFALHAKGSFYVPLTVDRVALAPFLALLGLGKNSNEEIDGKTVLHPVTISVNFQPHMIR